MCRQYWNDMMHLSLSIPFGKRVDDEVEHACGRIDAKEDSYHIGGSRKAEYDPFDHNDGIPNEVC